MTTTGQYGVSSSFFTIIVFIITILFSIKIAQKFQTFNQKQVTQRNLQNLKNLHTFSDIILLFQYNWTPNLKVLKIFLKKWKTVATRMILAIPFYDSTFPKELYDVETEFIKVKPYKGDKGCATPMKNLVQVIDDLKAKAYFESISGILQLHDDMLVNTSALSLDSDWKKKILTTGRPKTSVPFLVQTTLQRGQMF